MSLYEFVDTAESPGVSGRPAEAVCFNGVWLDDVIEGFRTLSVSGREVAEKDVDTYDMKRSIGESFTRSCYPPRTITVTYQIMAESDTLFRRYYNELNGYLAAEQAQLIFNDEPDKYFIATKKSNNTVDSGINNVVGEIDFYCADPIKYATTLTEFTAAENSDGILEATIVNNGTVAVPINYSISHSAENGYIGIVSDDGAIQLGKIDEADGETYQHDEQLVTISDFFNAPEDTSGTDVMHPKYAVNSALKSTTWYDNQFLCLDLQDKSTYQKGMRTVTIPADSNGDTGSKNFYSYFHIIFHAGLMGQAGEMSISWLTSDGKQIAGVNWYKTDTVGNTGNYELWANEKCLKVYSFQANHLQSQNPWAWDWGHCDLRKEGAKLTFFYWGNYPSYNIPEVEDWECTQIQIAIRSFDDYSGSKYVSYLGLNVLNFWKMYVDKWKDVPNRYQADDEIYIDGETAKVYVNGMVRMQDEIRGSKYFLASPGETTVQFSCSDFCESAPTIKAAIREAYL